MKEKQSVVPIYGQDFLPGYPIFTVTDNSFISNGIIWFQNLDERIEYEKMLNVEGFSHVLWVVNEHFGIEAAEHGIQFCNLEEDYFTNAHIHCVCREPIGIDDRTYAEAFNRALQLKGHGYDFPSLLGFALSLISRASDILPFLRKLPIPLHIPGTRVCSAFYADCMKHTQLYRDIQLFKDYHVTRIHVHKLWNHFPFKGFRYENH